MFIFLLTVVPAVLSSPEAEYQIFPGFNLEVKVDSEENTTILGELTPLSTSIMTIATPVRLPQTSTGPTETTVKETQTSEGQTTETVFGTNWTLSWKPSRKFTCPEEEQPSNIGSYEVPTQRDLVMITQKTLHRMFSSYHQKVMLFLEDISKATRATLEIEKKCRGVKSTYRRCVKQVSHKCETITKSLSSSLEMQKQDVVAFGKHDICSLNDMKEDPVRLMKVLASEEVSLELALPGFLRLLNSCSVYCMSPQVKVVKPTRHLTDTDLVVRHFLTTNRYTRLVKDPKDQKKPKIVKTKKKEEALKKKYPKPNK